MGRGKKRVITLADYEARMCLEKKRFKSENEAKQCNESQRAYQCPICDFWHLTKVKTFVIR